jgi:hypothetical protein
LYHGPRPAAARASQALGYGIAPGTAFGLFFLLIRPSGELWPVAAARIGELAVVLITAAVLRGSLRPCGAQRRLMLAAAAAGAIDVTVNICYVAATRTGMFGLAVVLASLYPAATVLLPGWCLASGCAGSSGQASVLPRSPSSSSQHKRTRQQHLKPRPPDRPGQRPSRPSRVTLITPRERRQLGLQCRAPTRALLCGTARPVEMATRSSFSA